ncbi:MAG: hypothetical protein K4571_14380 [Deltaproteobacteria bacterium]
MITRVKSVIRLSMLLKRSGMIKVKKILPVSKRFNPTILHLILYAITGIFLAPACLWASEVITTYDKKTIRYPSMFVGQIWAKSGETPTPAREGDGERISASTREKSSSNLQADPVITGAPVEKNSSPAITQSGPVIKKESVPDPEIKKQLRQKRLKTIQALDKGKAKKTASNPSWSLPASSKENQKTSEGNTIKQRNTASSRATGFVTARAARSGKNWHHKQELYDVECSYKLARVVVTYYFDREETLLGSNVTPDAGWYHIYPGSLEEKLYVELCHPSTNSIH